MSEDNLILKPYNFSLNDAISLLHKECGTLAGPEFPDNHIRISLTFPQGYDKFLRLYDSFRSYLIWDNNLNKPIAIITGVLKFMHLHGKLRKIGIITDLKQLPDYDEFKPAAQLFTKLEQDFKESGVEYVVIYYTANIISILGEAQLSDYDLAATRNIKTFTTDVKTSSITLEKLSVDQALSITSKHYYALDFLPNDLKAILSSEYYLGTYQVSNANGNMGISAWSPTDYCTTTVSEVYWPIRNTEQAYAIFIRILMSYLAALLIFIGISLWIYEAIPEQMLKLCFFVVALYVFVKVSLIVFSILEYLKICYENKTKKVSLFGFYSTAKDFDSDLFSDLIRSLQNLMKDSGYSILQLNFDSDHDCVFTEIMHNSHEKSVLHKSLTGLSTYCTVTNSFLDPRDVL